MRHRLVAVFGRASLMAVCTLAVSCGRGSSPTAASTPGAAGKLTVTSLRSGSPIAGAVVKTVVGTVVPVDGEGTATLPESSVGGVVSVEASNHYGPYRFIYAPGMTLRMLPADAQMPMYWIKEALFGSNDFSWLWRPEPGTMTIVPTAQMRADEFAMQGITDGVDIFNRSHKHIRIMIASQGTTGDRVISVALNPAAPGFAVTQISVPPGTATIVGAAIDFSVIRLPNMNRELQRRHFTRAVAHELAHVAGLIGHPGAIPGVSNGGIMWGVEPVQEFSQAELDIMDWEYTLPPGTRPPADTTQLPVSAKSFAKPERRFVCALGYDGMPVQ